MLDSGLNRNKWFRKKPAKTSQTLSYKSSYEEGEHSHFRDCCRQKRIEDHSKGERKLNFVWERHDITIPCNKNGKKNKKKEKYIKRIKETQSRQFYKFITDFFDKLDKGQIKNDRNLKFSQKEREELIEKYYN